MASDLGTLMRWFALRLSAAHLLQTRQPLERFMLVWQVTFQVRLSLPQ